MAHRLAGTALLLPPLTVAAIVAACTMNRAAPRSAASGRQCFSVASVNGFHAIDRDTVRVTVGARTYYELELVGTCPEVDWSNRIAIRSRSGSSWVCEGLDAELIVPSPHGTERCPVIGVRKLTPEEVEAVRASRRH